MDSAGENQSFVASYKENDAKVEHTSPDFPKLNIIVEQGFTIM